jgi:hypothetical protein
MTQMGTDKKKRKVPLLYLCPSVSSVATFS